MARAIVRSLRQEAVGVEGFRVLPEVGMPVREVGAEQDGRPGRNAIAADLIVVDGVARDDPDRRIQPQRLLQDHRRVREPREVGNGWDAIADDLRRLRGGACARPPGAATAGTTSRRATRRRCRAPAAASRGSLRAAAGRSWPRRSRRRAPPSASRGSFGPVVSRGPLPLDDRRRCRSLSMRIAPLNRRLSLVGTHSGSGASAATRFFRTASADCADVGHLRGVGPQVHAEQHVADDHQRQLGHLVVERQRLARRRDASPSGRASRRCAR